MNNSKAAGVLGEAIALNAPVWIVYTKPGEQADARLIEPLEIQRNKDEEPYLLANEDGKGFRNFRLDRVQSAVLA